MDRNRGKRMRCVCGGGVVYVCGWVGGRPDVYASTNVSLIYRLVISLGRYVG